MTRLQFWLRRYFSSFQNLTKQPIDIWMQYQYMLWLPFLAKDGRNFCAVLRVYPPAMDVLPQEVRFTVEFVPGNRTYDLNRVLLHLGLGTLDCDINLLIFSTSWPVGRAGVPNVSHLADFWTAWDELLDPAMQYHLYVTDSSLMHHLDQYANDADHHLLLCPDQTPHAMRDNCSVVIHFVTALEITEALSVTSQHVRALEDRVAALEANIVELRQFLGI